MKLNVSWVEIPSEVIPHTNRDSDGDLDVIAVGVVEAFEREGVSEVVEIDPGKVVMAGILTSRMVEDPFLYLDSKRWGGKYFSGDVSASLAEVMAFALLEAKFGVKLTEVLPMRHVKYLGFTPDGVVDAKLYPKLISFLGGKGALYINTRGTMRWSPSWIIRNLRRDLIQVEKVRYPDAYAMLMYLVRERGWRMMVGVVKP